MEKFLMTPEGHSALEQKLLHLRNVERYANVKDIEEARAHGDISENSEYEDAKERQAMRVSFKISKSCLEQKLLT